jgi:2-oxoacid dehydrogenase/acyltransferase catalytic subunit
VTGSPDERLDYAERWLRDGLQVLRPPLSVAQVTVDMSQANLRLERLRREGVRASPTHLVVHAAARALAANPPLHQLIAGNRRHRPSQVDIGLSVSGDTFVAPVLVLKGVDQKSIADIAEEVARGAPEVREVDRKLLQLLRRWGWLVPVGFVRRAILRLLFTSPSFRQRGAGTLQVSTVPTDWALTATFASAGVLIAGQVWNRVVAVDGQPAVRPTMTLTFSGDHGMWDGRAVARFLAATKANLEEE